jgi:hypothetical protein
LIADDGGLDPLDSTYLGVMCYSRASADMLREPPREVKLSEPQAFLHQGRAVDEAAPVYGDALARTSIDG